MESGKKIHSRKGDTGMDLVKCEGVRKVYGSGNSEVVALDGIDLTVRKGEFVAVTGVRFGKIYFAAYPGQCGQANERESDHRRDGPVKTESDAGGDLPAQKGRPGVSVL